jgi:hypothetical protein
MVGTNHETPVTMARAVVTGVSWFVPTIKTFPVSAAGYEAATRHLALPEETATRMRGHIRTMCAKLTGGVPASLPAAF